MNSAIQAALIVLSEAIKAGDTVYTSVVSVARSGMSRQIKFYIIDTSEGKPWIRDITRLVGTALDTRQSDKTGGLIVSGCGMDMCYHMVYSLSREMFPDVKDSGYLLNKRDL